MATLFFPTPADVDRYRRLRTLGMDLNSRMLKTVPRLAFDDIGSALGMLRNGVVVFDSEEMTSVMADSCLYDWYANGKNLVQRYAEQHSAEPQTDERYLLNAYLQAKYRILVIQSVTAGAGVYCQDVLNGEELFLMDLGLSQSDSVANAAFAMRTIPLGDYSMSSGAALPINSRNVALDAISRIAREKKSLGIPGGLELSIVRVCLAAGAANHIAFHRADTKSRRPRHQPRRRF